MYHGVFNLILAVLLSIGIIFGWQYFYERPRLAKLADDHRIYQEQIKQRKTNVVTQVAALSRDDALLLDSRVRLKSSLLEGSISKKGVRFDDLVLLNYRKTVQSDSGPVELLSPYATTHHYFGEFGWLSQNDQIDVPNSDTIWNTDKEVLEVGNTVTFSWKNAANVLFQIKISLDRGYMFTVEQHVLNSSNVPIAFKCYGLVNKAELEDESERAANILHQGMIGVIEKALEECPYAKIKETSTKAFQVGTVNWLGISDKYWQSVLIPDSSSRYSSYFRYIPSDSGRAAFESKFVSGPEVLEPGAAFHLEHKLFAGAKNVDLLDIYEDKYNIYLFDRSIDFGWLYPMTKPLFKMMNFCYGFVGNFGVSIMIITVIMKILLFGIANKSYKSMNKMKQINPQLQRLRDIYADDKVRLNQEIVQLYKRENVNPLTGCLPLLIQIPIFFALYKVLYVTIEMRHAPFFGWIRDLSAPDPSSVFNLFGLLPFVPPQFLMIGAWPLLVAGTMYWQQTMSAPPADPVQAKVMKFMPLFFVVMFARFPAGLLVYWTWSNLLSIVQQSLINRMSGAK